MSWLDSQGNNTYHFDIGEFNWHIGTWRQLIKVVPVVHLVKKYNCKSVVDIGCGVGDIKKVLVSNDAFPEIFCGIDVSDNANSEVLGDSMNLPIETESVDLATCIDLLQNVPHDKRESVLSEIDRIVTLAGLVYLFFRTDNFDSDIDNEQHNLGGCNYDDTVNFLKNFDYVSSFGVNSVPNYEDWPDLFPYEFNRIFYSLGDFEETKFIGVVLKKIWSNL